MRTCQECQAVFTPASGNQKYCNKACKWKVKNRLKYRSYITKGLCPQCGHERDDFYKTCSKCRAYKDERRKTLPIEIQRNRDMQRKWREQFPDRYKNSIIKNMYGISLEEYRAILENQGGVCAICGTENFGTKSNYASVDHNHETGEVRGLLCRTCNIGLGMFKDKAEVAQSAAKYLLKYS